MKKTVLGAVAACAGAPLVALGIGSAVASATPPDLFGSSGFAPTPNALAAALVSRDSRQPLVGPGGSIIGNGLDADPTRATPIATAATAACCSATAALAPTAARAVTPG